MQSHNNSLEKKKYWKQFGRGFVSFFGLGEVAERWGEEAWSSEPSFSGFNGLHPAQTRSAVESHPFGGKHFHCSVCRASGWGPFFPQMAPRHDFLFT